MAIEHDLRRKEQVPACYMGHRTFSLATDDVLWSVEHVIRTMEHILIGLRRTDEGAVIWGLQSLEKHDGLGAAAPLILSPDAQH